MYKQDTWKVMGRPNWTVRSGVRGSAIAAAVTLMVGAATLPVWALSVTQAYVFSDWSSPSAPTGAPFAFSATSGYQLTLNGTGIATSATALTGPTPADVIDRLYYRSHSGTVDPGESWSTGPAGRVNNEIGRLDDAGFVSESVDARLNIDFTNNSTVSLNHRVPVPGVIIFEDAGLDPFSLRYCHNLLCTSSTVVFAGLDSSTTSTLLSSGFGSDDSEPGIDQAFWFLFDQPATGGYFKFSESVNLGGSHSELLEIDFIGITKPRAIVPEPATLLLLGSGMLALPLLGTLRRR